MFITVLFIWGGGGEQNLDEAQISCTEAMLKLDACVQF